MNCVIFGFDESYDEDFIVIFPVLAQPIAVKQFLQTEVPLRNDAEIEKATQKCLELGIKKANSSKFHGKIRKFKFKD